MKKSTKPQPVHIVLKSSRVPAVAGGFHRRGVMVVASAARAEQLVAAGQARRPGLAEIASVQVFGSTPIVALAD